MNVEIPQTSQVYIYQHFIDPNRHMPRPWTNMPKWKELEQFVLFEDGYGKEPRAPSLPLGHNGTAMNPSHPIP